MWWQSNQIESNRVELDYSNIHGEISAGCSLLASSTTKPTISSDRKIAAHVGLSFESHHLARFVYIRHTAAYGRVCVWVHYSTNFSFQEAQCSKLCTVLYDIRRLLLYCSPPHDMKPFRNARTIVATWMAFQIGLYVYCIQQPLFASHMISILELFQLQLGTILS